jgi:hypothetical protein
MDIKEMLKKSFNISMEKTYKVLVEGELKEITYMELGLFLVNNSEEIDRIEIIMKED